MPRIRAHRAAYFKPVLRLANGNLDRVDAIKVMLPIVVFEQVTNRELRVCSRHLLNSLYESEVAGLRAFVAQALDLIARGGAHSADLVVAFHATIGREPLVDWRPVFSESKSVGLLGRMDLRDFVFLHLLELSRVVSNGGLLRRCSVCKRFFFPATRRALFDTRSCSDRYQYRKRTGAVPAVSPPNAEKARSTV